jgi:hypothetical protein
MAASVLKAIDPRKLGLVIQIATGAWYDPETRARSAVSTSINPNVLARGHRPSA